MRKLQEANKDKITREEWLQIRKKGIGGSDIAAICGFSPYKSALAIYLDKSDQKPLVDRENIAAEVGLELESYLSKKFTKWMADKEGLDIDLKEMPEVLQHDKIDYFLVNLDRWFLHPTRGNCVVELKTTTEFKKDLWKGDEVPDEYYAQVQWQLMITGWKWGYLVVLIGNRIVDVKLIPRNQEFITRISKTAKEFWTDFVEKEIPPAPTGTDSDDMALKTLYPAEEPGTVAEFVEADVEMLISIMGEIDRHSETKRQAEEEIKRLKQIVKWKMGDYESGSITGKNKEGIEYFRKITLKTVSIAEHLVSANSYRKLVIGKEVTKENG